VHTHVRHYVRASAAAGLPWVITADEMGGANVGASPDTDDPDHDDPRRFGLWGTLMAGGAGIEWYFGWQNNSPTSDLSCDNWRTREALYRRTRIACDFFRQHLPFWKMQPADELITGHGTYGLAIPGEIYAIYLPHGGGTRFDLGAESGFYEVKWFNPRAGGDVVDGPIKHVRGPGKSWTGFPPAESSQDWLALIRRRPETAPAQIQFPTTVWTEQPPEELGVQPSGLLNALNYWRAHTGQDGINEVVMARRGVVFHRGSAADKAHLCWSVTKSFTSAAAGLLVADGVLSLETKATQFEPLLEEHYSDVTLRHFLTMTSGYAALGSSRWNESSEDWSRTPFLPASPMFAPGEKFAYWDEAQMMLGRMLSHAAQRDLLGLLKERVFDPIGLVARDWTVEGADRDWPQRNGCTGLTLDPLSLARFGHLYLNEGRWRDRQLIARDWVRQSTTVQVPNTVPVAETDRRDLDGSGVYGFNWWINGTRADGSRLLPDAPARSFYAVGLNHNLCVVIPEWEMVIVRMGQDGKPPEGHAAVLNTFLRKLSLAVSPLATR
jgi:CubicO group peptidase (beta-lactamase class C family)